MLLESKFQLFCLQSFSAVFLFLGENRWEVSSSFWSFCCCCCCILELQRTNFLHLQGLWNYICFGKSFVFWVCVFGWRYGFFWVIVIKFLSVGKLVLLSLRLSQLSHINPEKLDSLVAIHLCPWNKSFFQSFFGGRTPGVVSWVFSRRLRLFVMWNFFW